MKIRNVLLVLFVLVLVAGGGAVYYLYSNLGSIVKSVIEERGTAVLGTRVSVGFVTLSATTGEGSIGGLRVANPSGFPPGDAFSLGEISVGIDIATLTQSPIVVKNVRIAEPVVNAVVNEKGETNLDVLRRNAQSYSPSQEKQPSTGGEGAATPLIRIDRFRFEQGRVGADLTSVGSKQVETELPQLDLRQVGGTGGSPPGEVGKTIAIAFTKAVTAALARTEAERWIDKKVGGEAGEAAKTLLRRIVE